MMESLFNVTGKIVLITGSSRGIGFSLANIISSLMLSARVILALILQNHYRKIRNLING